LSKTKTRKNAPRRYARVQVKKTWYEELPLLPIVVGAVLLVGAIIVIIVSARGGSTASTTDPTINGIPCASNEQLAVHYHAHLSMIIDGNATVLPAGTGIDNTTQCLYWLHVHANDGVIHIEAPASSANRKFTLGDVFAIWGKPLSKTQVGSTVLTKSQKLEMWVDGKPYTGDPSKIVLGKYTQVVLEVSPPEVALPAPFVFPAGL
jgi:hypothetical protein